MTSSQKLTLALSYLRSALNDFAISAPFSAVQLRTYIRYIESFRNIHSGFLGRSYSVTSSKPYKVD